HLLADLRMDYKSLMAAILHDVIEDTPTRKDQLAKDFGSEVADLVDGVSKLTQIEFESRAEAQAENFRKMVLAMANDIRVIIIKLADRLHNMRTLGVLPPNKRRRIARETLDIYVPIANRLGMNSLRVELQDLGFSALYPMRSRILQEAIKKARGNRKELVQKIELTLRERLSNEGITAGISGREKHLYSIYQKMRNKHLSVADVMDVYAFRIVVDKVDTCYRVLGAVHNLYKPMPGRFKDYIALPKANGYQSLHSVLLGPMGLPIEVQIRTEEMHKVAEAGIASHWLYKTGDDVGMPQNTRTREWLRGLLELQKNTGTSMEFLENVKIDLYPDGVFVFTPKGAIKELPRGATAVDFAYAVHSELGNSLVSAKVDRRIVPLNTPLQNGQTVEVITAPGAKPNPTWLNFVVTGKARSSIRSHLKSLHQDEAIALGQRLLERALSAHSLTFEQIPSEYLARVVTELKVKDVQNLLGEIGFGNRIAPLVAKQFAAIISDAEQQEKGDGKRTVKLKNVFTRYAPAWLRGEKAGSTPLAITGTEGIVVSYAKCCRPVPGDRIVGSVTSGRGIVVHTTTCKNIADARKHAEKWVEVQWAKDIKATFPVEIRVEVKNQRGVLAEVAAKIAENEANIENVLVTDRDERYSDIDFTIDVRDRVHLAKILRGVRALEAVSKIIRTKN
ncbi:MAG: RelA/SpoT family protein, partial [Gammaproteobacteria bacterium]|nr:RelA/SpoT family protein [Gammaproteobacteria bacterium]